MFDVRPPTEMDVLSAAAAGMSAQRTVLDISARNVAAAQAATPDHPYARLVARFGSAPPPIDADGDASAVELGDADHGSDADPTDGGAPGTTVVGLRSEPGSGDALTEMIAVLDAQRAYEQHASVFDIGKRLAERTIDMGRA